MFQQLNSAILDEIKIVLNKVNSNTILQLIKNITEANNIITCGAGRMGMVSRSFAMRLAHLNLKAYNLSDCNVPRMHKDDLLIVCSGSGETQTIYDLVVIAKKEKAKIALVTSRTKSRMSQHADTIVHIPAPSKINEDSNFNITSIQPMTTLNEQCLYLFFDTIVLMLMGEMNETAESMKGRHSILE